MSRPIFRFDDLPRSARRVRAAILRAAGVLTGRTLEGCAHLGSERFPPVVCAAHPDDGLRCRQCAELHELGHARTCCACGADAGGLTEGASAAIIRWVTARPVLGGRVRSLAQPYAFGVDFCDSCRLEFAEQLAEALGGASS